ncbi:MAG: hypothetical protein R3E67_02920 [Pseudomonadales bacterium]
MSAMRCCRKTLRLFQTLLDALSDSSWDGDRDNWSQAVDNEDWRSA